MNKIATLAIIGIISAGFVAAPAKAGGLEGGARFQYAPNVWGTEKIKRAALRATMPVHTVQSGMVPRSLLGIDPSMLSRPVAPVVVPQTRVAATPSFGTATPSLATPAKFDSSFGKPAAPVVAKAPAAPVAQVAKAAPPMVVKPAAKTHSSSDVHGVLAHHPSKSGGNGLIAHAGPSIASYGQDFGYKPGGFNPASIGGGRKTSTSVSGTLIKSY